MNVIIYDRDGKMVKWTEISRIEERAGGMVTLFRRLSTDKWDGRAEAIHSAPFTKLEVV